MPADLGRYETIQPKARHVFECFKIIDKQKTKKAKLEQARLHLKENMPFQRILMWNSIPRIESMLPEGIPPYNANENDGEANRLWEYMNMFTYFVKSTKSVNMKPLKIEQLFINMLEVLPKEESDIICLAKDGKINEIHPWLTNDFVREVDATLFAEVEPEPKKKRATKKKVEETASEAPETTSEASTEEADTKPKKKAKKKPKKTAKRRTKKSEPEVVSEVVPAEDEPKTNNLDDSPI